MLDIGLQPVSLLKVGHAHLVGSLVIMSLYMEFPWDSPFADYIPYSG